MDRRKFIKISIFGLITSSATYFFLPKKKSFNVVLKDIIKRNIPYLKISDSELSKFANAYLAKKNIGFADKITNIYEKNNLRGPIQFEKDICEKLLLSTTFFNQKLKSDNVTFKSLDIHICGNPFARI